MADIIRKDNVELGDIERLAGIEQNLGEDGIQKCMRVASSP